MNEDKMFILKHKNHDVAILQLSADGDIENYQIINPARMPYVGSTDARNLHTWWKNRAIPEGRARLVELLKQYDCQSPSEFLMKNLGLSLSDAYWISPAELDLTWEEVNLYDSGNKTIHFHSADGRVHYSNQKDASLGGNLDKYSIKEDDIWYLGKYSDSKYPDGLQNVNEGFVSMLHNMQGFKEYTSYEIISDGAKNSISRCKYFTTKDLELIPAFEVTGGYNLSDDYDGGKELAKFIRSCINNGLNADYVRHFLDYMLMTDFIITNSDRHWYNFGILRDTETMRFVSMAPIYDNGNSMFYNIYSPLNRASLLRLEDNGIIKQEVKRLDLVQDKNIINTSLLPTPSQVEEYYLNHAIDKERVNIITCSYSNKLDLFMEYQLGLSNSYNPILSK
jgi:hypothetical protein